MPYDNEEVSYSESKHVDKFQISLSSLARVVRRVVSSCRDEWNGVING